MNIGAAAKASGLSVKTVRYYSDIDLVNASGRSPSGYRQYTRSAVSKLMFVKRVRAFGFTVRDTRELLSLYEDHARPSSVVKRIAKGRLKEIESKMEELKVLHEELSHLIRACRGDDRPDCPIISSLAADTEKDNICKLR